MPPDETDEAVEEFIQDAERDLEDSGEPRTFDEEMLTAPISELEPSAPIIVEPQAPALEAITLMQTHRIGCVLVCRANKLKGIFTERDVLTVVVGQGIDPAKTPVRKLMTENPEYLRREAYGYYLALVDYFSAGTPSLDLEAIQERSGEQGVELRLILDDGLNTRGGWRSRKVRILPSTIYCRVDGKSVPFHYDEEQARLSLTVPFLAEPSFTEAAEIVVRFQNLYKNSNFPSSFELRRDPHGNLKFASTDSSFRHKKMRY